ncbi:MAG TPA: FecR family protein [Herbaspirillum sp.]|jgi:hypothetical protein
MSQPRKCTAINALLFAALALIGALAGAAESTGASTNAGAVMHMSGALLATRAGGASRILAPNSAVNPGETLVTQKNGYAQIKFSDGSLLILKPATTLTIDKYFYDAARPEADAIVFTLQQGAIRVNAGLVGKRSKDRVKVNTPSGTVGMENASAIIEYQPPEPNPGAQVSQRDFLFASMAALDASMTATRTDAPLPSASTTLLLAQIPPPPIPVGLPPAGKPGTPTLAPGLYVHVIDGLINVTNSLGSQSFAPGQFGFTPFNQPPVVVPQNPGLIFSPPPSFGAPLPVGLGGNGTTKSNTVDCEVR